jgi:hypothetical protein
VEDLPRPRKPYRPRFSLRGALLATTVLAVGIGYWAARHRAMARIAQRHNELVQQLVDNLTTLPAGATFARPALPASTYSRYFGNKIGLRAATAGNPGEFLPISDRITTTAMTDVLLKVNRMPAIANTESLLDDLVEHYASGLPALGLKQTISTYGKEGSTAYWTVVWTAAGNELIVDIEARREQGADEASVTIMFFDSQRADLW